MLEKRYVRADGSVLLGRLSVSAFYDAGDKPAFFIGPLGWSPRELLGRAFVGLVHEDDRAEFDASFAAVLDDPARVLRTTLRMRHRVEGHRFFDRVGRSRLEIEALAGVVVTLRDVTEQRTLQAQLARAATRQRLAGGVAPDFNNMRAARGARERR